MGREALRGKWIKAVAAADIGNACKALLLYFATQMTTSGYLNDLRRDDLADLFDVHPQRIAECIHEARQAGLLDQIDGSGVRGRRARYVATLPPKCVPLGSTHEAGFLTGERYPLIGTHENALGTGERYTQHARVLTEARQHDVHERHARGERNHIPPEERSDEEVPHDSRIAAVLQKYDGRRPVCTGLRAA